MIEIRTTPSRRPTKPTNIPKPAKPTAEAKTCIPSKAVTTLGAGDKVYICSPFRPVGETAEAQA